MHQLPAAEDQPTVNLWPDAGEALGISRSTTYLAALRGDIPGLIRVGKRYRVATAALRQYLALNAEPASISRMGVERQADDHGVA